MYRASIHNNHLNPSVDKYVWTAPLCLNECNAPICFSAKFIHIKGANQ